VRAACARPFLYARVGSPQSVPSSRRPSRCRVRRPMSGPIRRRLADRGPPTIAVAGTPARRDVHAGLPPGRRSHPRLSRPATGWTPGPRGARTPSVPPKDQMCTISTAAPPPRTSPHLGGPSGGPTLQPATDVRSPVGTSSYRSATDALRLLLAHSLTPLTACGYTSYTSLHASLVWPHWSATDGFACFVEVVEVYPQP